MPRAHTWKRKRIKRKRKKKQKKREEEEGEEEEEEGGTHKNTKQVRSLRYGHRLRHRYTLRDMDTD